jgi:predicted nuclease of predicted toxin-antitoxin system
MRLYLDDDSAWRHLTGVLRQAGHDVQLPNEAGIAGRKDAVHLTHAIRTDRVLLTKNYKDFEELHQLALVLRGHHPGILVLREDNDPRRDLRPAGVVRALRNLLASGQVLADDYIVLNHWR